MLPTLPRIASSSKVNAAVLLAANAQKRPNVVALRFEDRSYTWQQLDQQVNRTANALRSIGVSQGDAVPLLMDNRPEFVFAVLALTRLGAIAALINTNVTGAALVHAITIANPVYAIVGAEHAEKLAEVVGELPIPAAAIRVQRDGDLGSDASDASFESLDTVVAEHSAAAPPSLPTSTPNDTMCFIYTSGTTGLPKAAIISHKRYLLTGGMFGGMLFALSDRDTVYVTLPLYHSNGMFAGLSAALSTGACMALRRKFSASQFWDDVRKFDATAFIYIGELCRYLLNRPPQPSDRDHKLRVIAGNGLRPDIWEEFQQRFGIPTIREFYGATEGNAPLANLAGRAGMVGRLTLPGQAVIRADLETGDPLPGPDGFMQHVSEGDTGLLVAKINATSSFDGYVDKKASEKKILHDVFAKGDRYFNSGDLVIVNDDKWISFADRVGDTFRWKGENVSTNEVAETLNAAPGVLESNVYGVEVPGADGRAGMTSVNVNESFSIADFAAFVCDKLPGYMRPYFVRVQRDMRITGTFKHQKVEYRKEGYDPAKVSDPLYFLDSQEYIPLDAALYEAIQNGDTKLR